MMIGGDAVVNARPDNRNPKLPRGIAFSLIAIRLYLIIEHDLFERTGNHFPNPGLVLKPRTAFAGRVRKKAGLQRARLKVLAT
jgi:hypothetical protein